MTTDKKIRKAQRQHEDWTRERDKAKNLWVISVVGFWITCAVLALVFFLKDELNFILLCVALGMMVLGVWLKTRYQLIARRAPKEPDHGEDHQPGV